MRLCFIEGRKFTLLTNILREFSNTSVTFSSMLKPYINIHGQLVRPPSQDSDGFRRPESLRSSRNTLTPEPELPPNQWQPRGSEPEEKAPEINYVSYLV